MNPITINIIFLSLLILALVAGRYAIVHSRSYLTRLNRKIDREELLSRSQIDKLGRGQRKLIEQKKLAEAEEVRQEQARLQHEKDSFRQKAASLDEEYGKNSDSYTRYTDIADDARTILEELAAGKKYCVLPAGEHRDYIIANWFKYSGKKKFLVVSSREKVAAVKDPIQYFDKLCGNGTHKSFENLELISWDELTDWYHEHSKKCLENPDCCLCEYAIAFDEVHNAKGGNSCERGMAFLNICEETSDWIGLSAEMGNNWGGYTTFFVATKIFENSSDFEEKYAYYTYMPNGDKFVAGYSDTSTLLKMWNGISVAA